MRHRDEGLTVVDPSYGGRLFGLGELPAFRELLFLLAWRHVKVRCKQTLIGVAWAIIQPLLAMVIFTVVFSNGRARLTGRQSVCGRRLRGSAALSVFATVAARSTIRLVTNTSLISKIYSRRVIIPTAALGDV